MPRVPDPRRSAAVEAGKPPLYAPDTPGTFYCQAGDHIVDHAIWLESITLGCRPCMTKLGRDIATVDWMPRLWSVGAKGAKRARPIAPERPLVPPTAKPVYKKTQDWRCGYCGYQDDAMNGYFNTLAGYVCQKCTGRMKMDSTNTTPLQIKLDMERKLREKIVERTNIQIGKVERRIIKAAADAIVDATGIPPHREEQFKDIPKDSFRIVNSTETRPATGRVGEFVYVLDLDQLFTWSFHHGWIQIALTLPIKEETSAAGIYERQRKQRMRGTRPTFTDQRCPPGRCVTRGHYRYCHICGGSSGI